MEGEKASQRSADLAIAGVLVAGTALYLSLLPHTLNSSDESYFLYEAKRIGDGEIVYRDIFEFVTPLAPYTMAGLFWLFGTTVTTARVAMAFVHGLTAAMFYGATRQLAVRSELAILVPLAYLTLCQAVWPFASWHWFATCLTAALLLAMIAGPWARRPRWAFVPGLVSGMLIGVQQQKGVVLAAGVAAVFVIDFLIDRRYPDPQSWRQLATRLAWWSAGVAAIAVPLLLACAALAGGERVYRAVIRFPLDNYRATFRTIWGAVGRFYYADYTYPAILRYSPFALVLPAVRWAWALWRARDRCAVRRRTALIVLAIASALSIRYYPDVIHIAFIAGVFWVAAADGLDWMVNGILPSRSRVAGIAVLLVLGGGLVAQLVRYAYRLHEQYPIAHQTAFGRINFGSRWEPILIDTLREQLDRTPTREIFCYPQLASPYLMAGARNPTPYQFLLAGTSPAYQVDETLRILEARRVPYVIGSPFQMQSRDPIVRYFREHYEAVPIPQIAELGEAPVYWLYRRKDDVPAPSGDASR